MILDDRQRKAIEMLATGNYELQEIAKEVGVSRQTLWSWRKEPEFTAELNTELTALREEAITKLKAKCGPVMDELLKMALSDKTDARTKAQCLQYLTNRLYGMPTSSVNMEIDDKTDAQSTDALAEFNAFIAEQTGKCEEE